MKYRISYPVSKRRTATIYRDNMAEAFRVGKEKGGLVYAENSLVANFTTQPTNGHGSHVVATPGSRKGR